MAGLARIVMSLKPDSAESRRAFSNGLESAQGWYCAQGRVSEEMQALSKLIYEVAVPSELHSAGPLSRFVQGAAAPFFLLVLFPFRSKMFGLNMIVVTISY